jgi:hypothetical protein
MEDLNMEKCIFDESNGLWYELRGDYYFPCLTILTGEEQPIGIWGQRHRRYLREYKRAVYTALLLGGKLDAHLADIDHQAEELFSRLVEQMAEREGITERLKAENQMEWVGKMNNIRNAVEEIVFSELINT